MYRVIWNEKRFRIVCHATCSGTSRGVLQAARRAMGVSMAADLQGVRDPLIKMMYSQLVTSKCHEQMPFVEQTESVCNNLASLVASVLGCPTAMK